MLKTFYVFLIRFGICCNQKSLSTNDPIVVSERQTAVSNVCAIPRRALSDRREHMYISDVNVNNGSSAAEDEKTKIIRKTWVEKLSWQKRKSGEPAAMTFLALRLCNQGNQSLTL